ncbi:MAG: exo-alpha-sialidase [Eubacterium sp.]|nr:exo-alpha-sialidase [Eubacterium sp.]
MAEKQCLFGKEAVYRIPSLVNTGKTLIAVCNRETNDKDYGYMELVCKTSSDGGKTWGDIQLIAAPPAREISSDEESCKSAFFIDPSMTVADNGDIILLATFFPESKGIMDKKYLEKKAAFTGFDSKTYPVIYDRDGKYYIVLDDGKVLDSKKAKTPYRVEGIGELYKEDEYLGNIYLNGAKGKTDSENTSTTFGAPLKAPKRSYIYMFRSSDEGKTWSEGKDITRDIYAETDGVFLGIAPGSALKTESGRLIFPLYTLKNTLSIYSDDNGETFKRNKRFPYSENKDEWCAVEAPNNSIYAFGRAKKLSKTPVSVSADNAITWMKSKKAAFKAPKCQKSAIAINNNIFVSHPSGKKRENGVISKGEFEFNKKGKFKGIKWNKAKEDIIINEGFFAYSCLAKINDETLGILYEDEPSAHIVFETVKIK